MSLFYNTRKKLRCARQKIRRGAHLLNRGCTSCSKKHFEMDFDLMKPTDDPQLDGEIALDGVVEEPESFEAEPRPTTDDPVISDLAAYKWDVEALEEDEEAELVARAKAGDRNGAGCKLLEHFHKVIKGRVGKRHIQRLRRAKCNDGVVRWHHDDRYDDLIATGALTLWEAVLNFELEKGECFSNYAVPCIAGEIAKEAKRLLERGAKSETRLERHIFFHPKATPEDLVAHFAKLKKPVHYTLLEAREAIETVRARLWPLHYPTTMESGYSEDDSPLRRRDDNPWCPFIPRDRIVVKYDPSGGKVTDADWAYIKKARARPSGLPGGHRLAPEPLKEISRERYAEDQAQAHRADEAKFAQYHLGFNLMQHWGLDPRKRHRGEKQQRIRELARLVSADTNPFQNGRPVLLNGRLVPGLIQQLADSSDLRELRRLAHVGRRQFALELVERDKRRRLAELLVPDARRFVYALSINSAATATPPADAVHKQEPERVSAPERITNLKAIDGGLHGRQTTIVRTGDSLCRDNGSRRRSNRQANRASN